MSHEWKKGYKRPSGEEPYTKSYHLHKSEVRNSDQKEKKHYTLFLDMFAN